MRDSNNDVEAEVQLRPATAGDIPAILAVTRAAYAPYTGRIDPPSGVLDERADDVQRSLEQGGVIVAQAADQIVGVVRYQSHDDHVYLGRLGVLPPWQRRGVGRRLIAAVEEWTTLLGLDEVRLNVRHELTEHHALYKRLGYIEDGQATFDRAPHRTYLKMKKHLNHPSSSAIAVTYDGASS